MAESLDNGAQAESTVERPRMPAVADLQTAIGNMRARPAPDNAKAPSHGHHRPAASDLQSVMRKIGVDCLDVPTEEAPLTPRSQRVANAQRMRKIAQVKSKVGQEYALIDSIGEPFTVKLSTFSGESTEWRVFPGEQVNEWRSRIAAKLEVTDTRIRLLNGHQVIKRHLTCEQNNLEEGTNVTLIVVPPIFPGSEIYNQIVAGTGPGARLEEEGGDIHNAFNEELARRTKMNDAFACVVRRRDGAQS